MMKKNLKLLIVTSVVILLPVLVGLLLWNRLPDQIPSHWNAAGEVDGWCGKAFAVFGLPVLMLALQWVGVITTFTDPRKANHTGKVLQLVFWLIPVLSIVLFTITYVVALGTQVRMELVMPIFMGLLFTAIGNYLPKCRQNYTIGIKIPWTLHSEENWNRTHRFTGRLWVVCGLAMMLTGFIGSYLMILPIAALMVLVPLGYSYLLHRRGV